MSRSRTSQRPDAGTRGRVVAVTRGRVVAGIAGALVAVSCALPAGASAVGITFIAPSGARTYADQSLSPAGYTETLAFRTTDTRPVITIQATGADSDQLQCHFDNVFVTQTCGGPGPGCASICGSFQPATSSTSNCRAARGMSRLRSSNHTRLAVDRRVGVRIDHHWKRAQMPLQHENLCDRSTQRSG